jgi:hypothetical protein
MDKLPYVNEIIIALFRSIRSSYDIDIQYIYI